MKIGIVIVMYDEFDIVLQTIKNIKKINIDSKIVVVQSKCEYENSILDDIKKLTDKFIILPNLAETYDRFELPSQAICRNISVGNTALHDLGFFNCIAILTGDTLITDAESLMRRYKQMKENNFIGMVSKAVGQNFHSSSDDPKIGICGSRYQKSNTTDFACCFFLLDGETAIKNKAFCNIEITNKFTSEQCLGDEMLKLVNNNITIFNNKVGVLNNEFPDKAYSYSDGIIYHAKTGSPSR
jgi:hypothetical protein